MIARRSLLLAVLAIGLPVLTPGALAQASLSWRTYVNARFGYSIQLPLGLFEVEAGSENGDGLRLVETGGLAQIEVLGSQNAEGATPETFAAFLSDADRVRTVTYRTGGSRWFVLSGYYEQEPSESEELIFYTKYLFNRDHTAFAAFEISYPRSQKARFSRIVTRIEKSLRAPA